MGGFRDLSSGGHLDLSLLLDQLWSTPCLQFANVLAIETIEIANSCEPFIEVDDILNKLKIAMLYVIYLTMMMNT